MKSRLLDWFIVGITFAALAGGISLAVLDFSALKPAFWETFRVWIRASGTSGWIAFLFAGVVAPAIAIFVVIPFARGVLRTGKYEAYGQRLTRAQNPVMFWLAIVNWFVISAVCIAIGGYTWLAALMG